MVELKCIKELGKSRHNQKSSRPSDSQIILKLQYSVDLCSGRARVFERSYIWKNL